MSLQEQETKARILRIRKVRDRTGLAPSSIYEKIAKGEFPKSIALGARAVGWIEAEIDEWIAARKAQRDAHAARPVRLRRRRRVEPAARVRLRRGHGEA